jgi:putative hydrolase
VADVNVQIAGLLLEMGALQPSRAKGFGYSRAGSAIFSLDDLVTGHVLRGTLRDIRGIGPAAERIVLEYLESGSSATVQEALAAATPSTRADVERRRLAREGFLSRASVRVLLDAGLPPAIVSAVGYRGDFQMHTTWSDGAGDVEEMAEAALARGWSRIAVTDHSYGLPVARGMTMEHARRQQAEIAAVNERLAGRMRILQGLEANILADGTLDLPPAELRQFELVVAAPHSALRKAFDQTERMVAAVRTPGVHILGHPRGRVFNKRAGIVADWRRVFAAAAASGVAIELDGTWDRQDIDASLATQAFDAGCLFALDSDAHAPGELAYVDYALAHARLAGIPSARVINCWDDRQMFAWLGAAWER